MKKLLLCAIVLSSWLCISQSRAFAQDVSCTGLVTVTGGQVTGFDESNKSSCGWLGIPYAAPPVGDLRWKAPQPPASWTGVKKAVKYSPWCMQKQNLPGDPSVSPGSLGVSEDCLYLNVWRPKKEGKYPVMVWIHGGGYTTGSGNIPMYRGDRLAAKGGVVVVNLNYRLNVFGFMADYALAKEDPNGSTGNYGSLDQVAALKWVKENIAQFGGDPDNVTIFGESAGGWSVCAMVATPLTKGLFQRAIIQSGWCDESASIDEGQKISDKIFRRLHCEPGDLNCMRSVRQDLLMNAAWADLATGAFVYINHNDGYLLKKTPYETISAGEHNKVPMIIGTNRNEAKPVTLLPQYQRMTKKKYRKSVNKDFKYMRTLNKSLPGDAEKAMALYPLSKYPKPRDAYADMISDRMLGCTAFVAAEALAKQGPPVYYYRFDYDDIRMKKLLGAFHGLDIAFVFDAFDRKPISLAFRRKDLKAAEALSEKIMAYWVAFARTGDPNNAKGQPQWPRFEPAGSRQRIVFDNDISVMSEPKERDDQCNFWHTLPHFITPGKE